MDDFVRKIDVEDNGNISTDDEVVRLELESLWGSAQLKRGSLMLGRAFLRNL